MIRTASPLCLFCEARAYLQAITPTVWQQQTRSYASRQAQKKRPARLELSNRVSQAPERLSSRGKPIQRNRNSPFAAMNRTQTNLRESEQPNRSERRPPSHRKEEKRKPRQDGEYKALKMQRALTNVSYDRRSDIRGKIVDVDSFNDFPLLPVVKQALASSVLPGMEKTRPTPIQRVALPALLGTDDVSKKLAKRNVMQQFLLAAETGSGKTLAYLLPILDSIKRAEAVEVEKETQGNASAEAQKKADRERQAKNVFEVEFPQMDAEDNVKAGKPRVIVLVPTAELVNQVISTAKLLSHIVKFRAEGISATDSPRVIKNKLFRESGIDVLVATPHLLASIAETERAVLSKVTHLVIDEADSLLDRSFVSETTPIIDRSTPTLKQLILCSATIPRSLDNFLRTRYPDIRRLVTPNLHAIPRRVQLGVVDVEKEPYKGNKSLACADTIWSIGKSTEEHAPDGEDALSSLGSLKEKVNTKRIIVFVNERETAKEVTEYLISKGIEAVALSRDTGDASKQAEALAEFTGTAPAAPGGQQPAPTPVKNKTARHLPNTKVLVATDLGSRGIDTTAVRHVILYDVPHSTIDFIHRLGRTGRMGRRGRGIVLVGRGDRRDVVKEVREGMFMGKALI